MGEYEPNDSRDVTQSTHRAPGEPARTGPQEAATRRQPRQQESGETELEQDERGEDAEQVLRDASMEHDAEELGDSAPGDRND